MPQFWQIHRWLAIRPLRYLLPVLIGGGLWLGTEWITDRVLNHSYRSIHPLETTGFPKARLSQQLTIISIEAKVNHSAKSTEVTLETTDSALNRMEFEYPLVEPTHLETALVNELGMVPDTIRDLIRYQFD